MGDMGIGSGKPSRSIPLAGDVVIQVPKGLKPLGRTGLTHGYHCGDVVEIPTSLTCNVCPLYHIKKKSHRHPLACAEGKQNLICPILTLRQVAWAEMLIGEVREVTGGEPRASDHARVEQIVRIRSRIFQIENFLKVGGLIDLRKGEMRNVGERLTTVENSLSRALSDFRQALDSRRNGQKPAPRLEEYLEVRSKEGEDEEDDGHHPGDS